MCKSSDISNRYIVVFKAKGFRRVARTMYRRQVVRRIVGVRGYTVLLALVVLDRMRKVSLFRMALFSFRIVLVWYILLGLVR